MFLEEDSLKELETANRVESYRSKSYNDFEASKNVLQNGIEITKFNFSNNGRKKAILKLS